MADFSFSDIRNLACDSVGAVYARGGETDGANGIFGCGTNRKLTTPGLMWYSQIDGKVCPQRHPDLPIRLFRRRITGVRDKTARRAGRWRRKRSCRAKWHRRRCENCRPGSACCLPSERPFLQRSGSPFCRCARQGQAADTPPRILEYKIKTAADTCVRLKNTAFLTLCRGK